MADATGYIHAGYLGHLNHSASAWTVGQVCQAKPAEEVLLLTNSCKIDSCSKSAASEAAVCEIVHDTQLMLSLTMPKDGCRKSAQH